MKEKLKGILAVFIVIMLLPYVLTVIFTGSTKSNLSREDRSSTMISVKYNQIETAMDLEEYLIGVVAKAISIDSEKEALKAQAVIARTNIIKELEDSRAEDIEIIFEEPYLSINELKDMISADEFPLLYNKLEQAVSETYGEVITYQDQLIEAPFHAVSSGTTRSGQEVFKEDTYGYLIPVISENDMKSSNYLKIVTYSANEIIEKCREYFPQLEVIEEDIMKEISIVSRDSAQYVTQIKIGNITMSGEKFRNCLNLNSSCFTIEEYEGNIRIITKGLGHGMGISQYSANAMAAKGNTYDEIIHFYFNEVIITKKY